MSKIVKIELSNFRNIKHIVLDVKSNPAVIQGDNNLGKSSILNAVNWFFTDTLLTDKWGTGENDIDSIIPINQVKGEYVSVSITFSTGTEFTKNYKTAWDTKTGKPKGHTTEGLINGAVSKNMTLWKAELMKEINFNQTLFAFNELRLFTDPLYALQKMEAKELRQLLVALGCEVTTNEVYEALECEYDLSIVKSEETKYRGNFYDMRADYKRKVKADTDSLVIIENQLRIYNDVEEFDSTELESLEGQIKDLRDEYYKIKDEDTERMLKELETKIMETNSAKLISKQEQEMKMRTRYNELLVLIREEKKRLEDAVKDKNKDLINEKDKVKSEYDSIQNTIEAYHKSYVTITNSLTTSSAAGKRLVEEQKDLVVKLEATKNSTFQDMVTCPVCYNQFALDPQKQVMFEANKQQEIVRLNSRLEQIKQDLQTQKEAFLTLKKQREDTSNEMAKLNDKKTELWERLDSLCIQIESETPSTYTSDKLSTMLQEKLNLEQLPVDTSQYDSKLQELYSEKRNLEINSRGVIEEKRAVLNDEIQELELKADELKIEKSKWLTKADLNKKYADTIALRNNHESVLNTINAVIHKTIELCNHKAYLKTGFHFVMLEETLSETIKEVCYLTVDGVPFKDVNTSRKAIIGTMFIAKIKEILLEQGTPKNDLPILFDKLESISMNTLNANDEIFKDCQFICTKVTEGKEITIC